MRRGSAFVVVVAALALAWAPGLPAQSRPAGAQVRLIETGGVFHGDEMSARTGESWLGLYVTEGGSSLVPSVVRVEPAEDPVGGGGPGNRSGKVVSVNRKATPVFLVSGAHGLLPGRVVTSYHGETRLTIGSDVPVRLAGEEYRLSVTTAGKNPSLGMMFDDAKLVLSKGPLTQIIYDLGGDGGRETETAGWQLLWAGDLDGDHKLDLYVQVSGHYDYTQRKLFLSSRARPNQLVGELADFTTSGC
ncbi:MAG TPA: hypothetical protein VJ866_12350 [Pyrinomonadaceae bacterium]|nr:hypothetical protein [Pyrinomonadaceae bacterium]